MDAFHARDPYVPNEQIRNNLPEPLVRLSNLMFYLLMILCLVLSRVVKNYKFNRQLSHPKSPDMVLSKEIYCSNRPSGTGSLTNMALRYS